MIRALGRTRNVQATVVDGNGNCDTAREVTLESGFAASPAGTTLYVIDYWGSGVPSGTPVTSLSRNRN